MKPVRAALAALSAAALSLPLAAPASAAEISEPLATGLAGPLDLSVARDGNVFVAQAFAGLLTRHGRDGGEGVPVASLEGGEIAGVDATWAARTAYVSTGYETPSASLVRLNRVNGKTRVLADLQAYEQEVNPDGDVHYGFFDLPPGCTVGELPTGGTTGYDGIVEAHPYAVAAVPGGFVVADAAANSLLMVTNSGAISTLAVLPKVREEITEAKRQAINEDVRAYNGEDHEGPDWEELDDCVVGHDYDFESVPTDVEVGPDGLLYVSALTGGPETPAFGPRSKVFTVDRRSGELEEIGSGFAGAVDLAVDGDGEVYVAELFGGQVSRLVDGGPETHAEVPLPGALEWSRRTGLVAAVDVFNPDGGELVSISE